MVMVIKFLLSLLFSSLSGMFYRMGGKGKPYASWMRDWVCPAFCIATLLLWWQPSVSWGWALIPVVYGIMGGAYATYWDFLFGYDNFYFHGFMIGLAVFPFCFAGLAWWIVLIQALISALAMGLWCKYNDNDVKEEVGRGFISAIVRIIHG